MSTQIMFVLFDSSGDFSPIRGVYSSFDLSKEAAYLIIDELEDTSDIYLHIYEVTVDSFDAGWTEVAGFSGQPEGGWWQDEKF
jgi:hypothetical protein